MITCNIYVELLLEMMIFISILLADNTFDGDWFESLHDERESHEENMEILWNGANSIPIITFY